MATARKIEIVPSVLPADLSRLGEAVTDLAEAGVDRIQWDVMDGHFVPNLTFGPDVIASCRGLTDLPFEAHLMVERPADLLDRYIEAGCDLIIIHAETSPHLHRILTRIRDAGKQSAVAVNPSTAIEGIAQVLDVVDMVLVMTINPGFGGQPYLPSMEPKIAQIRAIIVERGLNIDLEVDGGIGPTTVAGAVDAGANVLVAGSALFRDPKGLTHAVSDLRSRADAAQGS
ncbi:MAG: ribulose-phosphate 3-epimerase [Acidimicrobiales bacterium]